jgi:hypothetical protein
MEGSAWGDLMNVKIDGITVDDAGRPTFEAYGELKTLEEWLRDRRCVVTKAALYKRIFGGWTLERSMSIPLSEKRRAGVRTSDRRPRLKIVKGSRRSAIGRARAA